MHILIIYIPSFLVNRVHKKVTTDALFDFRTKKYLARIVTSPNQLVEKIQIFDAGKDDRIMEMAKKQGVTEELKAPDMMRWIGLMNNIRACADEIVLNDIVYS